MTNDLLFDLPNVPADFRDEAAPAPSFREQLAHAQMLLSWRKIQGLKSWHPPRNEERFVMSSTERASESYHAADSASPANKSETVSHTRVLPAQ